MRSGLVDKITVVGAAEPASKPPLSFDEKVTPFVLSSRSRLRQFIKLNAFIVVFSIRNKPLYVAAHTATTLPGAAIACALSGAKLFYFPHELESKSVGAGKLGFAYRLCEDLFLRKTQLVVTVNDYIRDWYANEWPKLEIVAVRNIPEIELRQLSLPAELASFFEHRDKRRLLLLYQGNYVLGRGIERTLAVAVACPEHDFVFIGVGNLLTPSGSYSENVTVFDAVTPAQISQVTVHADVGLTLIEPICESYRYSLPNKFWQYLQAEIPQIMTEIPEIRREGTRHNAGWFVDEDLSNLESMVKSLNWSVVLGKKDGLTNEAFPTWETESNFFEESFTRALK
jgi:hypothetical protein